MTEQNLLEVKELSKVYRRGSNEVCALQGVSLQIQKGESVAIMGPSGSGKSTLMHLLGCLDKPTSGLYLLNQLDIASLGDKSLSHIRSTQIGFVFQSFNLIPQLNVMENVEIPFLYQNIRLSDKQKKIRLALEKVGLSHRLNHLPKELSGGEMQRVAIARAFVIDPSLILADEPTGNLDFENGQAILNLFQRLNQQGVTIIIVTHDEFVAKHCKRIIYMRDGQIVNDNKNFNPYTIDRL